MSAGRLPISDRVLVFLLILLAALIALYWLAFFATDLTKPDFVRDPAQAELTAVWLGFEGAFPLPDGFVAVLALLSARAVARQAETATRWGLMTAGGLAYLGLIDVNFNWNHGFYAANMMSADPGMALEAAINAACLGGATYLAWAVWRRR